jgi:hypothetical protein
MGTAPIKDYVNKLVPLIGADGGIMEQVQLVIWAVIW